VPALLGDIEQVPPAYSAKRVDGRRAYELAREGREFEMKPARVRIDDILLGSFEGSDDAVTSCRMRVTCGGGTYVRSLARDLARAAGSAAHLIALRRTRAGVFTLADSVPLERLRGGERITVAPALDALEGYPFQILSDTEVEHVVRGIDVEARVEGAFAALVSGRGPADAEVAAVLCRPLPSSDVLSLVAFAERRPSERGERWQPRVVMRDV
jgi:tRNA pseudouridine55 synthase